jgi:hypothetical protein
MTKLVGYGTAVGKFDPVAHPGTQNNLARAAAGTATYGISLRYSAATTAAVHPVMLLTNQIIAEAQEDGDGGAMGVDAEGANANYIVAAASSVTGISQVEINSDTKNTTSTLDLKLLKVAPFPDNDGTLAYARWLVTFNNVTLGQKTLGIG